MLIVSFVFFEFDGQKFETMKNFYDKIYLYLYHELRDLDKKVNIFTLKIWKMLKLTTETTTQEYIDLFSTIIPTFFYKKPVYKSRPTRSYTVVWITL